MARALRVRRAALLAGCVLACLSGAVRSPAPAFAAQACAQLAAQEPQTGHTMPPQANLLFASDFPSLTDCEWGYPLGGWGGKQHGYPLHHTPVIFVHGNQADAENWYLPADEFKASAGYTDQELYALSYNGLENGSAGMPTCCQPAPESQSYWACGNTTACPSPPFYEFCCNGGHGASDDPNVADLDAFIQAVQQYTGSQDIDIVAHSLGVTLVRKTLLEHPELRPDVLAAVMIAGANHGTSVCRGLDTTYYGCDEIAPGTSWLQQLNAAGEAPGPTHWMSIYNGTDNADPFFVDGGAFDDRQSPHLAGADYNIACPTTYHNDLRVRPDIVQSYLHFLLRFGQSPGLAPANPPAVAAPAACTLVDSGLTAAVPEAGSSALLALPGALALVSVTLGHRRRARRRRRDAPSR
jgi:pimeloyl-ACP methyl ester carboxylesterase